MSFKALPKFVSSLRMHFSEGQRWKIGFYIEQEKAFSSYTSLIGIKNSYKIEIEYFLGR